MDILERVNTFLRRRNVTAYLVGGSVRDQVLGRPSMRDIDLALEGNASALARAFADATGGAFYLMDAEHNVARVVLGKLYVDFAELRGTLEQDLATRDLTVNAMARPLGAPSNDIGNVIDPFHGLTDLRDRQIRVVSDGSFHDPVRMLRAVRLAGELDMTVEPHTESLIQHNAALLAGAPMERARDEFFKILTQSEVVLQLRYMDRLGLLGALLPEVTALHAIPQSEPHVYDVFEHTLHCVDELVRVQARDYADVAKGEFVTELLAHFYRVVAAERKRGMLLRLATLLHDIGKAETLSVDDEGVCHFYEHEARGAEMAEDILRRLRFSNDEIEIITKTIEHHLRPPQLARATNVSNRAIYRFFRDTGGEGVDICVLALADSRGKSPSRTEPDQDEPLRNMLVTLLEKYYRAPETVVAPPVLVDGRTLMKELGLKPGPRIGQLLESIREAQADGQVSSREEGLALARKMLTGNESE
ncbi:MAG: CCA tRNA nucleotidyltransferase [Acidobacteriota bacterium]